MTTTAFRISFAVTAVAAGLLFAAPAEAQFQRMRVDIPFKFLAAGTAMPAGRYFIELSESMRFLTIEGQDKTIRVPVSPAGTHRSFTLFEKGGLRFEKLGGMHVLRSAWNRNRYEGCSLYRSKAERELAARLAGTKTIAWAR